MLEREAGGEAGGSLESGQQGSTTVAGSNLEDRQAMFFNKEGSSSMSHSPRGLTQCGM